MSDDNQTNPELGFDDDDELGFDLGCSSCNAELAGNETFAKFRVCPFCGRHYWMPARERIRLLVDEGSFQELNADPLSIDPALFHDSLPVADRLAEAREQPSIAEAIVNGTGTIGGQAATIIALDLAILGAGIGIVAGEKIALAMEHAVTRRLPTVAICSGGSGKSLEGVLSLAQIGKLAAGSARLRRVGVPLVSLLTHPTTGNALIGIAHQADIAFAEPGAQIGLSAGGDAAAQTSTPAAESLLEHGAIDGVLSRERQRDIIATLLGLLADRGNPRTQAPNAPVEQIGLRAAEELLVAREPNRPPASKVIERLARDMIEIRGDRLEGDSPGVVGGICQIGSVSCIVFGVERDHPLTRPSFKKISRLIRLATLLELPVVSFIETGPGGPDPSDAGAALALAQSIQLIVACPSPIITVAIGECAGPSGASLMIGDRVLMLEHAVLAQVGGDPAASARDCLRLGIADTVVPEPDAEGDRTSLLRDAIVHALAETGSAGQRRLLDDRTRRLRQIGFGTAAGREAAKREMADLQELQRMVSRSFEDLRHRWEQRQLSIPSLSSRPSMPHLPGKIAMPAITLPKISIKRPDIGELASRVATSRRATKDSALPDGEEEQE